VQCLLFADGGLFALGANVLNMGVVRSRGGYAVYASLRKLLGNGRAGAVASSVLAAWISVMAAAALFCAEFALSWGAGGQYDFSKIFALMVTVHAAIGVGEAWITGAIISFVLLQRPDLVFSPTPALAGIARGESAGIRLAGAGRFV